MRGRRSARTASATGAPGSRRAVTAPRLGATPWPRAAAGRTVLAVEPPAGDRRAEAPGVRLPLAAVVVVDLQPGRRDRHGSRPAARRVADRRPAAGGDGRPAAAPALAPLRPAGRRALGPAGPQGDR